MRLMRSRLAVLIGSVIVSGTFLAAGPLAASPASADTCTPHVSGSPGTDSFTLHINTNPCGEKVRGRAQCVTDEPGADPLVSWGYGPITTSSGTTSKVECGAFNLYFLSYGWQNYYSSGWHYHEIGEG